ncbi:MAG: alpha/beta hydrolase [Planctomycetota bacterium]
MNLDVRRCRYLLLPAVFIAWAPESAQAQDWKPSAAEMRSSVAGHFGTQEFKKVIISGLKFEKAHPGDAYIRYWLACAYAMTERPISSGKWLKKAAQAGFADFQRASDEVYLVTMRSDPAFIEALKLIRKNQDAGVKPRIIGGGTEAGAVGGGGAGHEPVVYVPPGLAKEISSPLIVLVHGYGTDPNDIIEPWKKTANTFNALLVAPQAPHAVGGGYRWGGLQESIPIVMNAVDYMLANYRIDRQRIVLCGFSQGGHLTYAVGFRYAKTFSGLIPIAGRYDPSIHMASQVAPNHLPKVFIMVGEEDKALADNKKAYKELKGSRFSVKLNVYPGVGHHLPENFDAEFRKALQFIWPG